MLTSPRKPLFAILFIAILFNACKKKDNVEPIQKKGLQIATDVKFGAVLTDSAGRTLYMFASDVAGTANCTGACETTWPVYYSMNASTDLHVKAAFPCKKVGVAVIGLEVPHAHIHLIPMNNVSDMNFAKEKLKPSSEELVEAAKKIKAEF